MIKKKKKLGMEIYPKTIYTDVVNMPDPMMLGITIHYYNYSDENLYMKIFIEGPSPWTPNAVNLGLLNSGLNTYVNLDNFTSRTKPTSATTEVLTLTLRGYSDSGYSNLLYTFSRSLTVVFIKSDDGTWTTDFSNNFDDGTVQGWAARTVTGDYPYGTLEVAIASDYVLSSPYALKVTRTPPMQCQSAPYYGCFLYGKIQEKISHINSDKILIHIGKQYDTVGQDYIPLNKWARFVIPLESNTTMELKIKVIFFKACAYNINDLEYAFELYKSFAIPNKTTVYAILNVRVACAKNFFNNGYMCVWLDDFKIISK
jgi:hypothetical protein